MDEDDEDSEDDVGRRRHRNGYEKDDFVVSDFENEEDAFDAVHPRRRPTVHRRQQTLDELGPPISRDARLDEAGLDDVHQDVVHAFVEKAHEVEENLRNKHGLRRPIFTEQQYREMAIRWTTSVAQMYTIRGVDKSKVDSYGAKFASLVQQFYNQYQEMMGRASQSYSAAEMAPKNKKREVVDLISDDDGDCSMGYGSGPDVNVNGEDEDEDVDEDDEDADDLESSRYFGGGGATRASSRSRSDNSIEQWHKRFDELSKSSSRRAVKSSQSNTYNNGYSSSRPSSVSGWRGGRKHYFQKNGGAGGSRGGSSRNNGNGNGGGGGGVSKRKGSVGRQSGRGTTPAGGSSRSKKVASSSGIATMPY